MTDRFLRTLLCSTALLGFCVPQATAQTSPRDGAGALPPVTIDAPRARRASPPAVRRAARVSRGTIARRAPSVAQRAAPVGYLIPAASTVGAPPALYAGGQVASGAQLGFLGNRGVMNTPFNVTSYTAKLAQDQQARTIGDVLQNDPSVRVVTTGGGGQDAYFIRGFYYDTGALALNGLYGIAPYYSVGANFVERVEVLKGPSVLLNGVPPGGTVGGSINLVSKKAPDFDITQVTATYASKSQFGTLVDIARRYGEQKEWGVRFNGAYRNGQTAFDRQTSEFGNAVIGVDYRGERIRASFDAGYQAENIAPLSRFLTFLTTTIPPAPRAGSTFVQPWTKYQPRDAFVSGRTEADITDWATVYGAIGYRKNENDFISVAPNVFGPNPSPVAIAQLGAIALNAAPGAYTARPLIGLSTFNTFSADTGVRLNLDTGPINHAISFNYSITDQGNFNSFRQAPFLFSNIYNPVDRPQLPGTLSVQNVATQTLSSYGVADTMSILNNRVQFTAGARRQTVGQDNLNLLTNGLVSSTQSVTSPAFALLVKPIDYISLYANYIEGLLPGTTVGANFANAGTTLAPFVAKQAEAGIKVDFGRITTTFGLFEITQANNITVPGIPLPSSLADGRQRNRGAEIYVFGEVTPELRLLGGATFIDGRQTKTERGLNDGRKAVGVPDVQVNIGFEWDTPFVRGLTLGARVVYTDRQFVNATNTLVLPDWTRFDIQTRYTFVSPWNGKPIVIRAAVENVANRSYYSSAYNGVVALGAPRTYLVSTTFNF